MLHREQGRRRTRGHTDLGVHVLHVMLGGAARNDQPLPDFGIAEAVREQPQHLHLALGETGRRATLLGHRRIARRGEHRTGGVGVEASCVDVGEQQPPGGFRGGGGPVRTRLDGGAVPFGGGEDARGEIEIASGATAVVAAAVEPLVMATDQRREPG